MYARSVEERDRVALDGKGKESVGKTVCPKILTGDRFSDFWQETILFRLLAGDHFCSDFWQETVCSDFWQETVLFQLLAGDRFSDLAGDRFQLLAGDHVSI